MPIIRSSRVLYKWLLPVVFGALVFKLSVWCGAEGYVSGLRAVALLITFYFHILTTMHGQNHIKSILILSSLLRLGLPSGLFPRILPTKTQYTPILFPIRATCPVHLILHDFITRTVLGEEFRSLSSTLISGSLSPWHGASSVCEWRNSLRYGG